MFGDAEREFFRSLLAKQLKFSGLRCLAWCFMGNHFHLLLEVPDKAAALAGWSEEDFVKRLGMLSSEIHTRRTLSDLKMWRENGNTEGVERTVEALRARLFDLSAFMKEFKHRFSMWFNKRHGRKGALWEERFKSVLVEGEGGTSPDGLGGLLAVAAYIDLNPVRAGLVDDPKDYRWCSYAAAVAGDKAARAGLAKCAGVGGRRPDWRKVARAYRLVLFGAGERRAGGGTPDGVAQRRRGFTQRQIEAVWKRGGRLPLHEALRCRVRFFTDGVVLGSKGFVEDYKARRRDGGADRNREGGELPGAEWGGLSMGGRRWKDGIRAPG